MGLTVLLVSGTEGALKGCNTLALSTFTLRFLKTGLALAVLLRTGLLQCAVTFRAFPIFWLALLPFKTNWLSSHFLLLGVLGVEAFSFLMLLKSDLLILGVLRLLVTFSWSFNESSLMMSKMVSSGKPWCLSPGCSWTLSSSWRVLFVQRLFLTWNYKSSKQKRVSTRKWRQPINCQISLDLT